MKSRERNEMIYDALSGISEKNVRDFIEYDKKTDEAAGGRKKGRPALRVIAAAAACTALFVGIYAGLKYLEYKGGVITVPPETTDTSVPQTEEIPEQKTPVLFRLVGKTEKLANSTGKTTYEYDGYGRLIKETRTAVNGARTVTEYTYDNACNVIKKHSDIKYSDGSTSETTEEMTYSKSGVLLTSVTITKNKQTRSVYGVSYEYDELGRVCRKTETYGGTDADGTGTVTYDYTYTDDNGSCVVEQKDHATGQRSVLTLEVDEHGLVVRSTAESAVSRDFEYVRDSRGSIVKTVLDNITISEFSYVYDGNLITREERTDYQYNYYEADVTITKTTTYTEYEYDGYGNTVKYTGYGEDGVAAESGTFEYEPVCSDAPVKKLAVYTGENSEGVSLFSRPLTEKEISEALRALEGGVTVDIRVGDNTVLSDISDITDRLGYDELTDNTYDKYYLADYHRGVILKANAGRINAGALASLIGSYHVTSITVYPG